MSEPTFQIPRDVIEPIIQAQVSAAVATALGGNAQIVTHAISAVLQQKVNDEGQPDRCGYNSLPFVQWLMNSCLRRVVRDVLETEIKKFEPQIRKQLVEQLSNSKSPLTKQLVESMIGAMTNSTTLKYRLNITCDER